MAWVISRKQMITKLINSRDSLGISLVNMEIIANCHQISESNIKVFLVQYIICAKIINKITLFAIKSQQNKFTHLKGQLMNYKTPKIQRTLTSRLTWNLSHNNQSRCLLCQVPRRCNSNLRTHSTFLNTSGYIELLAAWLPQYNISLCNSSQHQIGCGLGIPSGSRTGETFCDQ